MVTANMVLNNLMKLIEQEFNTDDIILAFKDFNEEGKTAVYIGDSTSRGYDKIAHIDTLNNTKFRFRTRKKDGVEIIEDVWMV